LILVLLLGPSTVLDLAQLSRPWTFPSALTGPLPGVFPAKPGRSLQAYRILQKASQDGPGLFFNDFSVEPYDQTVGVGVFGFNALMNPRLSMDSAKWAALIVNVNYEPFLAKEFPQGQWSWLDEKAQEANGGLMLGIVPLTAENRGTFQKWAKIHDSFQKLDWDWLNLADGVKGEPYLPDLEPAKTLLAGEPFLTALYWEKIAGLLYRDRAYPKDAQALQKALAEGVPSAHLYYKLGSILLRKNQLREARSILEKAVANPFNRTRSQEALQMLDEIEKEDGVPPS
jgi:tetratricopeptide (TPR) repeat protein